MNKMDRDLTNFSKGKRIFWIQRVQFLPSEEVKFTGETINGGVCVTNFRMILYCRHQYKIISIPIMLIRSCEASSLVYMSVTTKIGTTFMYGFYLVNSF